MPDVDDINSIVKVLDDVKWWLEGEQQLTARICWDVASYLDAVKAMLNKRAEQLIELEKC